MSLLRIWSTTLAILVKDKWIATPFIALGLISYISIDLLLPPFPGDTEAAYTLLLEPKTQLLIGILWLLWIFTTGFTLLLTKAHLQNHQNKRVFKDILSLFLVELGLLIPVIVIGLALIYGFSSGLYSREACFVGCIVLLLIYKLVELFISPIVIFTQYPPFVVFQHVFQFVIHNIKSVLLFSLFILLVYLNFSSFGILVSGIPKFGRVLAALLNGIENTIQTVMVLLFYLSKQSRIMVMLQSSNESEWTPPSAD